MKRGATLAAVIMLPTLIAVGCRDSFKNCENTSTCEPEGDGDGDGDGDLGGTNGDGDGDTGGSGTGGGGNDPCESCEAPKAACNEEQVCVECTALNTTACGEGEVCDEVNEVCVGCVDAGDCPATAPVCDDNECIGCTENPDCAEHPDTPVCSGSGECVGCLPASEEEDCGAKSCDPATFTCGPHNRESRGVCRSCVSDSDCQTNHRCVEMEYPVGTPRVVGYCLAIAPGCAEPYSVSLTGRTSLSGVTGSNYCGINEELATCEAVRALQDNWRCDSEGLGDGHCWPASGSAEDAVEVPGALCRTVGVLAGDRCTYACGVVTDCLAAGPASTCGSDSESVNYCGGEPN